MLSTTNASTMWQEFATERKATLATLRQQLATDTEYFRQVYNYTFEFSRPPGQRSLGAPPSSFPRWSCG